MTTSHQAWLIIFQRLKSHFLHQLRLWLPFRKIFNLLLFNFRVQMGMEGKQGHVVVVGSIGGARITPYQLGTWRHLEEDGSPGIPWDDQVRVRLRVGLVGLVDWLRPYRIGVPRHFRAGRFLKLDNLSGTFRFSQPTKWMSNGKGWSSLACLISSTQKWSLSYPRYLNISRPNLIRPEWEPPVTSLLQYLLTCCSFQVR